jgi:peptidoglycan/LPS O-acetylase OafA/YrhL
LAHGAAAPRNRLETLDLLRGIAILAVLIFHYSFRIAMTDGDVNEVTLAALVPYFKYGFLGVQLFFVISGFVIAYSAENRTAVEFGMARIARIYPGFLFCMTFTFLMTLVFGAPLFHATFTQWLANLPLFAPGLKHAFMDDAYWSLVYEFTFYGWIALFIAMGWFRRNVDIVVVGWLALAVLNQELIHSVALKHIFLTDENGFFAAGLALYEMYRGRRDIGVKLLLALSTVTAIGQGLHLADWYRGVSHLAYDDRVVAGLSVLAVAAVGLGLAVRRLPIPSYVVAGIGGITYPLYLLHERVGYIVLIHLKGTVAAGSLVALTATAMAMLAWIVWRFVERPGQRFFRRMISHAAALVSEAMALRPAPAEPVASRGADRAQAAPNGVKKFLPGVTPA